MTKLESEAIFTDVFNSVNKENKRLAKIAEVTIAQLPIIEQYYIIVSLQRAAPFDLREFSKISGIKKNIIRVLDELYLLGPNKDYGETARTFHAGVGQLDEYITICKNLKD